jgi:hypothetical protein
VVSALAVAALGLRFRRDQGHPGDLGNVTADSRGVADVKMVVLSPLLLQQT